MGDIFTVHGITFRRTGECHRCVGMESLSCHCKAFGVVPGPNGECPHFAIIDGKRTCLIHDTRHLHCELCFPDRPEMTHQVCIDFPDHPWLRVCRDGICGYSFERVDGGSMDDLPFLKGEPYLR